VTSVVDDFSQRNNIQYEPSILKLFKSFRFCPCCLSENGNSHKSKCPEKDSGSQTHLAAQVFVHNPPLQNGCPMLDSKCAACQMSRQASPSYNLVRLCENDLGGMTDREEISVEQISYQLEMCADYFLVKCRKC
jgi:hypothetical protein